MARRLLPKGAVREPAGENGPGRVFLGVHQSVLFTSTSVRRVAVNTADAPSADRWGKRLLRGGLTTEQEFGVMWQTRQDVDGPVVTAPERVASFDAAYQVHVGDESHLDLWSGDGENAVLRLTVGLEADLFAWLWNELMQRRSPRIHFGFEISAHKTPGDAGLYVDFLTPVHAIKLAVVDDVGGEADGLAELAFGSSSSPFEPW